MLRRWDLLVALLLAVVPSCGVAQRVRLELHPHVGDTLKTRLDQLSEMLRSRQSDEAAQQTMVAVAANLTMFSRAIVEGSAEGDATVLAITDSVSIESTDPRASVVSAQTKRMLEGQRVRLRILRDGSVQLLGEGAGANRPELSQAISIMPPPFPRNLVGVGDTWMREMPLPSGGGFPFRHPRKLRAVFRLDSLSRDTAMAYISMHGQIERAGATATDSGAAGALVRGGDVNGSMELDRRRGWLAESRFTITVHSTMAATQPRDASAMQFQMKITQRTRMLAKQ